MCKALRRAAHVLAAAGALGLARPAVAQPSAPPAGATAVRVAPDAGQARLEEFQVELALLGDPETFGAPLVCMHTGSALEVRGYVPNEFVRKQALETARRHCRVPVVDRMAVHGSLAPRPPAAAGDELWRGAAALVAEVLGRDVGGVEITAVAPGQLAVSGTCDSYEEKVAVSKKLRRLRGCTAVDNRLAVKSVLRDGRLVALVTADGSLTVAAHTSAPPVPPSKPIAAVKTAVPPLTPVSAAVMKTEVIAPPPVPRPLADAPRATKPADAVPRAASQVPAPHEARPTPAAYATTGVVVFDGDVPEPPPVVRADQLAALKRKVQTVCGPLAKDVAVTAAPDGVLYVQVKTVSRSENEKLTMKILQLPEMAAPNVRLDVRLAK